jgi:hypothetical protein
MFKKSLTLFVFLFSSSVFASDVEIVNIVLTETTNSWRADVTLNHADTGWEHYADGWRLVDDKGNEIANHTLYHPHVDEQPFTRSLSGFHIPEDIKVIFVEAHDLNRGWSPNRLEIDMRKNSGAKFKINRR